MSDAVVANDDTGGIPSVGDGANKPLGDVKTEIRAKTNIQAFFKVGMIIGLIVFLAACLLIYQKLKPKNVTSVSVEKKIELPSFATRNSAVKSEDIATKKAEIVKRDEDEKARGNALGIGGASAGGVQAPNTVSYAPSSCVGDKCPPLPEQRKLQGDVLVQLGVPLANETSNQNGVGGNGLPAGYPPPPDFTAILAAAKGGSIIPSVNPFAPTGSGSIGLGNSLKPTVLEAKFAGNLSNLDYLLKRGTVIPCSLKTGIDTTLPGFAICTATNDVYSANGKTLLVARGAMIHGEQQSSLKLGQPRVFLLWSRVDNPDGTFADLDSPAANAMGYSGIEGYLDNHFGERFGAAMLISIIKDATSFALANLAPQGANTNQNQFTPSNTAGTGSTMAQEVLKQTLSIPPTLIVNPATLVNVLVARDISFAKVYKVMD